MRIHDSKYDCGKKPKRQKVANDKNKFRWSRKWREKRNSIVERDLSLCLVCRSKGKYNYNNLEVHHIIPLEEDYNKRLDDYNLITLCSDCHEQAERGEISKESLYKLLQSAYGYEY
jgi:5-methylcytosine-specific restriction endonuclease McrA